MIERREGETSFKVRVHHDGMVRCYSCIYLYSTAITILFTFKEKGQRSSAALLLPWAEGHTLQPGFGAA